MNPLAVSLGFFAFIMVELSILFLGISTLVGLALQYISEERLRNWLSGKGVLGNVIGAGIGGLTPFCACSTIPLTVGMLKARVPFGSVMSFVVASPLLNPVVMAMMVALLGLKAALIYGMVTFSAAVGFGMLLQRIGFSRHVKNVQVTGGKNYAIAAGGFGHRVRLAFADAWNDFKGVLPYLVIGVAIGAVIKGYVPQDLVIRIAGPDNPLAVPVAAIIGIPLYIRATTAIPIGLALIQKGMGTGAVIALIIGGAGMAIPEMSLLASIFKTRLVSALVSVIFITAVVAGYLFNMI